jgi:flavin reductase (DIM6/NTAB) family NADH-FMN oxidoreductase RutF
MSGQAHVTTENDSHAPTSGRLAPRRPDDDYRDFMSSFPSGVAVVTTTDQQGHPFGFTCSSLCSVALDPPTLLVCVQNNSGTLLALRSLGAFAVNLLHDRAHGTALIFASGMTDRFRHVGWEPSATLRLPFLVDDAHSVAECVSVGYAAVGDHTVVFGEVESVSCRNDVPLLYGFRGFRTWCGTETELGSRPVPGSAAGSIT